MKWIRVYFDDGQTTFLDGTETALRTLEAGKRASVRALKLPNPCGDDVWIDCEKVSSFSLQDAASVRRMAQWLEPIADLGDELWPDDDKEPWE